MKKWIAVSNGAINLGGVSSGVNDENLLAINSIFGTDEPIGLNGIHGKLWEKLVKGPVADSELTEDERRLVTEFMAFGIASDDDAHESRITVVDSPWLQSPLHELVYALVACVARETGIEIVFIKGPILQKQGIRSRHHSGDVDVWVDPDRIAELTEYLTDLGWSEAPDIWAGTEGNHSITMHAHPWACDVDLHRYMPGCGVSPRTAFSVVRENSEEELFASVSCFVPSKPMSRVIYALHELRPEFERKGTLAQIRQCAQVLSDGGDRTLEIVADLKATNALKPALDIGFPESSIDYEPGLPLNWLWLSQSNRITGYLLAIRMLPWRQRIIILSRLVWPSKAIVDSTNSHANVLVDSNFMGRLLRIKRGIVGNKSRKTR
ncbi:hypothetical protein ACTXPA_13445 [Glutamicibacter arilaitensis]|uniref:hypothetical protein n=1 Tax=Glutamicibacter arilaitensis TaxID=256701 RepID=UPI003FD6874E